MVILMKEYKMIILDADDTLYDFSKAEKYAFENAMRDLDLDYNESYLPIYKKINIGIWKDLEKGLITQKELKPERFRRFLDEVGLEGDGNTFSDAFLDHLSRATFLFDGAMELVKELSKKYRLVLITNGLTRVQKYRVRQHEIAQYFEKVIISEEIGYAKPNPMIFVEGLKDLEEVNKDRVIIIGDSLTSDIQGGINYGIDTCWFNFKNKANNSNIKPTFIVSTFDELQDIIL